MAFEAVMYLWNKKPLKGYGSRMSESILAILCHIIKGEPVIKEKLEKQQAETKKNAPPVTCSSSSSSTATILSAGAGASSGTPDGAGSSSIAPPAAAAAPQVGIGIIEKIPPKCFR